MVIVPFLFMPVSSAHKAYNRYMCLKYRTDTGTRCTGSIAVPFWVIVHLMWILYEGSISYGYPREIYQFCLFSKNEKYSNEPQQGQFGVGDHHQKLNLFYQYWNIYMSLSVQIFFQGIVSSPVTIILCENF